MNKLFAVGAGSALLLAALAGSADAQGRGRGHAKGKEKEKEKAEVSAPANPHAVVVFKESDRPKFQQYFVTHKFVAEPLPPGIAMNLDRGKPLPPGIAKRVMPRELLVYVPRDANTNYYIVGDRVVAVRNGTIVDVLLNIFR